MDVARVAQSTLRPLRVPAKPKPPESPGPQDVATLSAAPQTPTLNATAAAQTATDVAAAAIGGPIGASVRAAVVHFRPELGEVERNRAKLVELTRAAADQGAKIVVHTEMATSGESFFSRDDIRKVAETVPGPTTRALGEVAKEKGVYVLVGLPEIDPDTDLFYNTAALIGPSGEVVGSYRKHSQLLESAWATKGSGPTTVVDTPYGKLGMAICADLAYPEPAREAALQGAEMLLAPANTGLDDALPRTRAFENDMTVLVANRYGKEEQGQPLAAFDQESLRIPLPFAYDFDSGSQSMIVTPDGKIPVQIKDAQDQIGIADIPLHQPQLPVERRPELYSLLAQDTLQPYTLSQMHLPKPSTFTVAAGAVTPGATLSVLPATPMTETELLQSGQAAAKTANADVVVGNEHETMLVTPDGQSFVYHQTHQLAAHHDELGNRFTVVDRPYARVALLQPQDLLVPETTRVLEKMGVDLVAVSGALDEPRLGEVAQVRTGDSLHIALANADGPEGIYAGGYRSDPAFVQGEGVQVVQLNTADVRDKKELTSSDGWSLLRKH